MPSAPEFRHAFGKIGLAEVVHQGKAHDPCRALCDQGIGAEIAVDLKAEHKGGKGRSKASVGGVVSIDLIDDNSNPVGNDQLQKQPPYHQKQSFFGPLIVKAMTAAQLRQQVGGAFDRACDQLGKEGNKQGVSEKIGLYGNVLSVYVHGVAEGLEGKKGDPHRQQDVKGRIQQAYAQSAQNQVQVVQGKIEIFKEEQNRQVQGKAQDKSRFFKPAGSVFIFDTLSRADQ